MSLSLKQVFDSAFQEVKFDSKLIKALYKYQLWYINKSQEHMEFFGGNLLGVQVIRFKDSDLNKFYDEVLSIDYLSLVERVKLVDTINHEFKISSDTFNLTCMYLIHRILTSPLISDNDRIRGAYDTALCFFYRCVAAITSAWFRYPTDKQTAQAAYANLSNKYLIKKLGTWSKVMDYRATELIDKENIHHKALISFNDDLAIVYAINDSQGRIKDLIKNYTAEFMKTHSDGTVIASSSSVMKDVEGEEVLKEKTKTTEAYIFYIRSILIDKNSFIKEDLISVIAKLNTNTSGRMIRHILNWIHSNYGSVDFHQLIDEFTVKVIVHSFYLMQNQIPNFNARDYPHILINLKNLYLSTRSTDPDLLEIRDLGEQIIKEASPNKVSDSLVLSTRTAIILYITLRAMVGKNH